MHIISWNINGIRSVYSKNFVNSVTSLNPDIICLQEIKAHPEQFPQELLNFSDYNLYVNSAQKKGYSGVAVYTKNKPQKVISVIGFDRFDTEGRILQLDFEKFTLLNVYIPNGARDKSKLPYKLELYKYLATYLSKLPQKNVLLVGDFNVAHEEIDLARPKENVNNTMFTLEERHALQTIYDLGYIDSFRQLHTEGGNYSWWAYFKGLRERNIGWRIDYCFVSEALRNNIKSAEIYKDTFGADHCPVGVELDI